MSDSLSRAYDDDDEARAWADSLGVDTKTLPTHGRNWLDKGDVFKAYAEKLGFILTSEYIQDHKVSTRDFGVFTVKDQYGLVSPEDIRAIALKVKHQRENSVSRGITEED